MKKFSFFLLLGFAVTFKAQLPVYDWAKTINTSQSYNIALRVNGIATGPNGSKYIAGTFYGNSIFDFDPSPATATLQAAGYQTSFVAKYDSLGNYLWVFRIAGSSADNETFSIDSDINGNVYLTGYFMGTTDFDPGPATATLTNWEDDTFIAKYDGNGNYVWAKQITGSVNDDWDGGGNRIRVTSNKLLVTGYFRYGVDFDPGPGTYSVYAPSKEPYLAQYDLNGNFLWARAIETSTCSFGLDCDQDNAGNAYLTGYFAGTCNFDVGVSNYSLQAASQSVPDIFFAKYDGNGNFIWARTLGSPGNDEGHCIRSDGSGNIYLSGFFADSIDFDPSPAVASIHPHAGNTDIYLAKYDNGGNYLWAKCIGGPASGERVTDLFLDNNANIYVAGAFDSIADFDPSAAVVNLNSTGFDDAFLAKYNTSGNLDWAFSFGNSDMNDEISSLRIFAGKLYCAGTAGNRSDFDPSPSTATVSYGDTTSLSGFFVKYLPGQVVTQIKNSSDDRFSLCVYPVPAAESVYLKSGDEIRCVEILDILGRNLRKVEIDHGQKEVRLDGLTKGTYFIRISLGSTQYVKKIIIE